MVNVKELQIYTNDKKKSKKMVFANRMLIIANTLLTALDCK